MSPRILLKNCLPFLILSILFQTKPALSCLLTPNVTVRVINHLPATSTSPLQLHCASKDNDLGFHSISLLGRFRWSFCESVLRNTLFFCHLWWDSEDGPRTKAFNVFESKWAPRCFSGFCNWEAREDGIYFTGYYPPDQWVKRFNWDGPSE